MSIFLKKRKCPYQRIQEASLYRKDIKLSGFSGGFVMSHYMMLSQAFLAKKLSEEHLGELCKS